MINTINRLNSCKSLTVGYLGGSITEGTGASDPEKTSWRARTTEWLRSKYPDPDIREINAAIGGTGSDLGAFRCCKDLLQYKPDLIFVEFSVNDTQTPQKRTSRAMEGIVRQILRSNPLADIVFVYTTTKGNAVESYEKGELFHTIVTHQKVAEFYSIPSVNVGKILWENIRDGKGTWEEYTTDNVHPTDKGYIVYAEAIKQFLEMALQGEGGFEKIKKLPEPLFKKPFEHVGLMDSWDTESPGWHRLEEALGGRYPHILACDTAGTELSFEFTGSVIGIYWLIAPDSGDVEWSVDGTRPIKLSSWDKYALSFTRANYCILDDDLSEGKHVLKIKVLGECNEQSKGTWIRLGAFLTESYGNP